MTRLTLRSILSILVISTIISSSSALPLDVRSPQAAAISVVNVDGSSDPTYTAPPQTVTQTISDTIVSTVDVYAGTETLTAYVTPTPTPHPAVWTHSWNSSSSISTSSSALPPCGCPETNATITSSTFSPSATATSWNNGDDGAPFRDHYPVPSGTGGEYALSPSGALPTGVVAASGTLPSGFSAPFPTLPPRVPYWYNETEVPNYRRRIIINE